MDWQIDGAASSSMPSGSSKAGTSTDTTWTTASVTDSIGRWKRDLTEAEAEELVETLGPPLEDFGYNL